MDSAEIALLYRVSEIARNYGLRPSEAGAKFGYVFDETDKDFDQFRLSFNGAPAAPEAQEKFNRMKAALGCDGDTIVTDTMREMEDKIESALMLAPRRRAR